MTIKETRPTKAATKILLVDDHAVFREGLQTLLQQEKEWSVCGQAEDAIQALRLVESLKPDIAIVDISLEKTSGLELTQDLRRRFPRLFILVLSMHKEALYAERCLRAGANGYLMKQEDGKTLKTAVRTILQGTTYVSDGVKDRLVQQVSGSGPLTTSPLQRLSNRELEVFHLIARGFGTRQMADSLHLSMKTIETHREHIRNKLSLKTTFELVQYALAWNSTSRAA